MIQLDSLLLYCPFCTSSVTQGVSVLTRYMGHRQIINPNKIQRQEGRVGESYGLVGAGGNSLYQKIDGGMSVSSMCKLLCLCFGA